MKQYIDVVQDSSGRALYNASIAVTAYPIGATVIYSDNGSTIIAGSTVTTDNSGTFSFWAPNGPYVLTVTYQGNAFKTLSPVVIYDAVPSYPLLTAGGTTDALTVANILPFGTLESGLEQWLIPAYTNDGPSTFSPDSLTVENIYFNGSALVGGEMIAGVPICLKYDGTQWNLLSSALGGSGGGGGAGTVTSVSVTTKHGISGTVASSTTTPAITLTLGDITPTTVVSSGQITQQGNPQPLVFVQSTTPTAVNTGDLWIY